MLYHRSFKGVNAWWKETVTVELCYVQIEDLSQQAQMAAAEKFKTPDVSGVIGNAPTTVSNPIPEESDEEVCMSSMD